MIDKSFIDNTVIRIIESSDILMEFFKPKSKLQDYDGMYGDPISRQEWETIKKIYNKTIQDVIQIVKSSLPGCKIAKVDELVNTKHYNNGLEKVLMSKNIIHLEEPVNYKLLQQKAKDKLAGYSFDEAPGNDLYDVIESIILNKFKKLGFEEEQSGMFFHKKYENLAISLDDSMSELIVSIEYVIKD